MIRMATSYFYQVRFFQPYMIPMSTAVWDPKWFHNFKDQSTFYVDKNGVVNGLRLPILVPGKSCDGLCYGVDKCNTKDPNSCLFLKHYRSQLREIDITAFLEAVEKYARKTMKLINVSGEPLVVFLFHEKPDNKCSEREEVLKWFKDNGIAVSELAYPIEGNY